MRDARDEFNDRTPDQRAAITAELHPISEREMERQHAEYLDDVFGSVEIAGLEYSTASVLKSVDEVAYRESFNNWLDGIEVVEHDGMYYAAEDVLRAIDELTEDAP